MSDQNNWRIAEFDDDFFGNAISTMWGPVIGGANKGTFTITANRVYGTATLSSGATGTFANDLTIINLGQKQFTVNNPLGSFFLKVRLNLSSITTNYCFVGVTDDVTTSEAPISSAASADTITTTATDACGFMYDTNMATDNWWLTGVASNVDATHQNSGVAPVASQFTTLAMSVDIAGKAIFYINNVIVGTTMTGAVSTGGVGLSPVIAISKNSGASSFNCRLDRVYARIVRNVDGTDN